MSLLRNATYSPEAFAVPGSARRHNRGLLHCGQRWRVLLEEFGGAIVRCVVDDDELVRMKRVALQRLENSLLYSSWLCTAVTMESFFIASYLLTIPSRPMPVGESNTRGSFLWSAAPDQLCGTNDTAAQCG